MRVLKLRSTLAIYLTLLALALSGCIEEFDVETEREGDILVINGRITNASDPQRVAITRTAQENRTSIPQGGAVVTLVDNQGNTFEFFQEETGIYVLPESYATIFPGLGYMLRVELDGKIYESSMTIMKETLAKDSIGYRFEDEIIFNSLGNEVITRKYNIYLKSISALVDEKHYFKWEAREVFTLPPPRPDQQPCFLTGRLDPQRVIIGESVEGNELILNNVLIASRLLNDAFSIKHYTLVSQLSISEEEYIYWQRVQTNIDQVGSIFDIPPAAISGNIKNVNDLEEEVYGYFSVAAEKQVGYSIQREDVPGSLPSICQSLSFFDRPSWCNCVGGIPRPPFF